MNIEAVYAALKGASRSDQPKFDVVEKWFERCGIIDDKKITQEFFETSYERLCPNREDLTLTKLIQLFGILARETKQDVKSLVTKFDDIHQLIVDEIKEQWAKEYWESKERVGPAEIDKKPKTKPKTDKYEILKEC